MWKVRLIHKGLCDLPRVKVLLLSGLSSTQITIFNILFSTCVSTLFSPIKAKQARTDLKAKKDSSCDNVIKLTGEENHLFKSKNSLTLNSKTDFFQTSLYLEIKKLKEILQKKLCNNV